MAATYDELDHSIYKLLRTEGPLSTGDVAERLGEPRARVYRRLVRLLGGDHGRYVASRKEPGDRKLYWFPVTGDVLTARNQELADQLLRELTAIVDAEHIPRGADITVAQHDRLLGKFGRFVTKWAKRLSDSQREALYAFWRQLQHAMEDTKRSDIVGLFGIRPFHPKVRVWEVADDAPPDLPAL